MLLTHQKKRYHRVELNMAAMIDVVFLLLIFFMCTSAFTDVERELQAQTPQPGPSAAQDFGPIRVKLETVPEGVLVTCDGQAVGTFDALFEMLKTRRAIADVPVLIEGQGTVPFRFMVAALDACRKADFQKAAFVAGEGSL